MNTHLDFCFLIKKKYIYEIENKNTFIECVYTNEKKRVFVKL